LGAVLAHPGGDQRPGREGGGIDDAQAGEGAVGHWGLLARWGTDARAGSHHGRRLGGGPVDPATRSAAGTRCGPVAGGGVPASLASSARSSRRAAQWARSAYETWTMVSGGSARLNQ